MGKRDFRKRESKKPKRDTVKTPVTTITTTTIVTPPSTVEVIKRGKKDREE